MTENSGTGKKKKCHINYVTSSSSCKTAIRCKHQMSEPCLLIIFVYLMSQPVAHLSDAPRRRLVVIGNSARIQNETNESSAWFDNVLGV